ncbi:MAG: hypothetical protein PUH54_08725, partial [Oscillospiraceae bacterium]|nr:hypothetical protein [Oscillospiraceae bacterium]
NEFKTESEPDNYSISEISDSHVLADYIQKNHELEKMRAEAVDFVSNWKKDINSSQVGRYIMMVKQADSLLMFKSMASEIKSEKSRSFLDDLIKHSEVEKYRKNLWKEYLTLILTLIKYSNRGGKQ